MAIKPSVKPRFATSDLNNGPLGGPNILEPSEAKKDQGWLAGEKPPREYFNWMHRLTYQWIDWLDETATNSLQKSSNLSDLANAATARTNLGLGTAATRNVGTGASDVLQTSDADSRFLNSSSNLSDLGSVATARTNLGLGTAAVANTGTGASNVPTTAQADLRYVRQVDFATEIKAGILEVATAAEAQTYGAGLGADDKIITPRKLSDAFNGNATYAQTGYQNLPGGLILQWTRVTLAAADTLYTLNFPQAFPTACLNIQATIDRTDDLTPGIIAPYANILSTSQYRIILDSYDSNPTNTPVFIFAIGY